MTKNKNLITSNTFAFLLTLSLIFLCSCTSINKSNYENDKEILKNNSFSSDNTNRKLHTEIELTPKS